MLQQGLVCVCVCMDDSDEPYHFGKSEENIDILNTHSLKIHWSDIWNERVDIWEIIIIMVFFTPGGNWWKFSIGKKHFQFSSWDHLITEQAKGELCNKMIETWKLKILQANWNVELKSVGMMVHGF